MAKIMCRYFKLNGYYLVTNNSHVPPVDNIRYGQAIDTERDSKDAIDDTSIPEALKEKAEEYSRNLLNLEGSHKKQGKITQSYRELGKKLRESKKQNRGGD